MDDLMFRGETVACGGHFGDVKLIAYLSGLRFDHLSHLFGCIGDF